jgi:hypothetical protein
MKHFYGLFALLALVFATPAFAAICPTTANTNSDCGAIITIGPGGSISIALVAGANPYDGSDDALIGVINNSGATFTGAIHLSGSGNGGGLFAFDRDGICTYITCTWSNLTGYEGPISTFSGINGTGTVGDVNISGLANNATTYFSLEGAPASLQITSVPEPSRVLLLGTVVGLLGLTLRRRLAASL